MRVSSSLLACAASLLCGCTRVAASNGIGDFATAGYPTMALLASFVFVALSIYLGMSHGGMDFGASTSVLGRVFLLLNFLQVIMGIFFIFGPGGFGQPQVNILGFQVMMGTCIGFYGVYTNRKSVLRALFVYLLVTIFCITGNNVFMGFSSPLPTVNTPGCLAYFDKSSSPDYNRCKDDGFLQLLRTFGMFSLFFMVGQVSIAFLAMTDDTSVTTRKGALAGPLLPGFGDSSQPQQQPPPQQVYNPPPQQPQQPPVVVQPYAGPPAGEAAPSTYQAL